MEPAVGRFFGGDSVPVVRLPRIRREKVILDSDMVEGFDDGVAMLALAQSPASS